MHICGLNHKVTPKLYIISYLGTILSSANCPTLHGRDDIYGRRVLGESDRKRDSHCWSQELQYNYCSTCGASMKMPGCRPGTSFCTDVSPQPHCTMNELSLLFHMALSCFPPLVLPLLSFLQISFSGLNNKECFCWPKRDFHLPCQHFHTHLFQMVIYY